MNTAGKVIIGGAVVGGAYLGYDYYRSRTVAGHGASLITSAVDTVRNQLPSSIGGPTGRLVATPYPSLNVQPREVRDGASGNATLFGIQELAREINGEGSQNIVAGLASCESTNGSMRVQCFNCNLFGMHISDSQVASGMPYIISRNERFIDFLTGKTSQVEGFKACLRYFQDWLQRHTPTAIAPMRAGLWLDFETQWANAWGADLYKSDLRNGAAFRSTLQSRYNRARSLSMAS